MVRFLLKFGCYNNKLCPIMVKILLCMCVTSWPLCSKKAKNSSIQHHFEVQFKITSLKEALKKRFEATNDGLFSDWLINGVDCSNLDPIWTNRDAKTIKNYQKKNNNKSDSESVGKIKKRLEFWRSGIILSSQLEFKPKKNLHIELGGGVWF